ncbi:DUF1361 domain-containing protein [Confluentibacter citreus]|uniref:DUF1361 domain-containing protein n=1 Tax=Confluentibacter citreus TaxID=2007307 RepID=UPI000C291852|nr:DUF1361 domain-containing protein [Confluentibacter citreus]
MDYLKELLFNRFKTFSLVSLSMLLSVVLLMIRMKLTHSFFFLFLIWNLFLAVIPFAITSYLISIPKLNKYGLLLWFSLWLLFLPNAPYIITDLLHLKISSNHFLWLDILVVTSFALNGLLMFFLSLSDMKEILGRTIIKKHLNLLYVFILFLCGFGVYLGRFLRYNSWEIIHNPIILLNDILNIMLQPDINSEAWLFTFIFGSFLNVGYWIFKQLFANPSK